MAKQRFTERMLRDEIDEINAKLKAEGIRRRLWWCPRNGYQAADEFTPVSNEEDSYSMSATTPGHKNEYGNVGCGTPREVSGYCWDRYYQLANAAARGEA